MTRRSIQAVAALCLAAPKIALSGLPHEDQPKDSRTVSAHRIHMRADKRIAAEMLVTLHRQCAQFNAAQGKPVKPLIIPGDAGLHETDYYYSEAARAVYSRWVSYLINPDDCGLKPPLVTSDAKINLRSGVTYDIDLVKRTAKRLDRKKLWSPVLAMPPKQRRELGSALHGMLIDPIADAASMVKSGSERMIAGLACQHVHFKGAPQYEGCVHNGAKLKAYGAEAGVMLEVRLSRDVVDTAYAAEIDTAVPEGVFAVPPGVKVRDVTITPSVEIEE